MPKPRPLVPLSRRRRWSSADARAVLSALAKSGLSASEFAIREGLDVQRLCRWQRRLDAADPPTRSMPPFLEVRPGRVETIEVVLGSGRVLRASESIEPGALARFVDALERPSPC